MLEAVFNFILKIFFWLVGLIGSIIIYPIQLILVAIFPGLGNFIGTVLGFFTQYIFPMISFVKEMFLDLSCLPRPLWSIFVGFVIARWGIAPAIRSCKLLINIWKLKSGGSTK